MRKFAILLALMVGISGVARGQQTTGAITGRVADAQGLAVPGVNVTVTGAQGSRSTVTDSDGRYSIPFLTPGPYEVKAELSGFKTVQQRGVNVALGQSVDVPVKLEVGGVSETVQVVGITDVVNVTTTTTGANITSDLLERVPVGRDLASTLYLAPGVSSSSTAGHANPSISGGSGLDNQYVVDGVNITNQGYGALGSYSIIFGSLGNATPFDFMQEVQVKTGGYEAEFGQAIGGVVNVITKSGSNDVRGSGFAYGRPQQLESSWPQYQTQNGSVQTEASRQYDAGVEAGFPLLRDRLFIFGAIDPRQDVTSFQPPTGFPLQSLGSVNRIRNSVTYSGKGTWQAGSNHRFDASFFGDPSRGDNGPQRISSLLNQNTSSFSEIRYGGHNQTLRYNGVLSGTWLVEAAYSRALNRVTEIPSVDAWRVRNTTVTPNVFSGGIGLYEANRSLNNQFQAKATNVLGAHQLRYGAEYDLVDYDQVNQRTGPTFVAPTGQMTATGAEISILADPTFGQVFRVTRANYNTGRPTTQRYGSAFIQDSWRATDRLTINPGLRYEQETLSGTIITGFTLKNNWAPRIGATYDLTGDARTKLYGNYGRYYARVPNDLAARALSADEGISRADYFDPNLTRPIPAGTLAAGVTSHYQVAGVSADTIDPDAKLSYTDEFLVGVDREILPNTVFSVRYTNRHIGRVLEDVANAPVVAYDLGVPGLDSVEYILTNPSSSTPVLASAAFLGAKFDDPVHKYQSLEFALNRRFTNNWTMMSSYRWSRLRGNFEGFYRDDNGQSDPGITSLYDFPTNDPSYTAIGVPQFGYRGDIRFLGDPNGILPLDRTHQVKLFGSYLWPMGIGVGAGLDLSSGAPLTPLAAHPNYSNGGEIPEAPRGSGIQTVDGFRTRSPFQSLLSLQASYEHKLTGSRSVMVLADVFNLLNANTVLMYDQWTQLTGPAPNPDFGKPVTQVIGGAPPQFQTPRQVRFGLRFYF